jgi:hypothetical protein
MTPTGPTRTRRTSRSVLVGVQAPVQVLTGETDDRELPASAPDFNVHAFSARDRRQPEELL